jgi:NADPH:quinone reductase-like Zn-dependent oxidoreductase
MKAAVIRNVGALPEVDDVAEPDGQTLEVLAAPINPIDLAVSRGVLATGHPELPYMPGCEAVGRTADGRIVLDLRRGARENGGRCDGGARSGR